MNGYKLLILLHIKKKTDLLFFINILICVITAQEGSNHDVVIELQTAVEPDTIINNLLPRFNTYI